MSHGNQEGSLDLDFEASENDGMEAYAFADRVKKRAADLGIGRHDRPTLHKDHEKIFHGVKAGQVFDGRLPVVIRQLSLDQLSALYSLYSNWYGYITTQTTLVAAERSEAIRQKEFMLNHLKTYYRKALDPKPPETAIGDIAKTDKRFVTASAKYEELNALYDILDAMRKVADQDMKVISREVTIQQEKIRKDLLQQGFGNRGRDYEADNAVGDDDYGTSNDNASSTRSKRTPATRFEGNPRRAQAKKSGRPSVRRR